LKLAQKVTVNRLRLGFLATAIVFTGIVILIFLGSRSPDSGEVRKEDPVFAEPGLNIGKIEHTATRNGMTEWQLEADSATYLMDGNQAVLTDLAVTFFLKNEGKAFLKARKGVLNTGTFDIDVSGNVEMENDGYRLETEQLRYRHEQRVVSSTTPVKLTGNGFTILSDTLEINLNTNRTLFNGNVKGTFNENYK
jgi:LPS export ABC transporter protein LptC